MTAAPLRVALRRPLREVRHVRAVPMRRATGLVRRVYRQVERDFGMLAPPIALHSPAPEVLAASWLMLRESLVAAGSVDRAERELVASAVSSANACPYCVEVHGMALGALGHGADAAALTADDPAALAEPAARALAAYVRGEGAAPHRPAGDLAEIVAVAVSFHYLNRMVNVFLGPSPLPAAVPDGARDIARTALGRLLRPRSAAPRGWSLDLLPDSTSDSPVPMPDRPVIAEAFARAAAALEAAGRRSVPGGVRAAVLSELDGWDGTPPGISRAWLDGPVSGLPAADRPVARLALLAALSSAQVDDGTVAAAREHCRSDRTLVETVAWAAFAAARRMGTRLSVPAGTH